MTEHPHPGMPIPPAINELLVSNKLLHLATSFKDEPNVSLMNYTYIPPTDSVPPTIILSSNASTQKTQNIVSNPNVALLIHDWTSHTDQASTGITNLLTKLNQAQIGSRSATLYGRASIPRGEEADYYRAKHLANNPDAACFIKNADIILVVPHKGKVADSSNNVTNYSF